MRKLIQLNAEKYLEKLYVPTCFTLDVILVVNSNQTDLKNKGKLLAYVTVKNPSIGFKSDMI